MLTTSALQNSRSKFTAFMVFESPTPPVYDNPTARESFLVVTPNAVYGLTIKKPDGVEGGCIQGFEGIESASKHRLPGM